MHVGNVSDMKQLLGLLDDNSEHIHTVVTGDRSEVDGMRPYVRI